MLANSLARPDLEKPPFTRYTVPGTGKVRESLVDSQENYFLESISALIFRYIKPI